MPRQLKPKVYHVLDGNYKLTPVFSYKQNKDHVVINVKFKKIKIKKGEENAPA